MRNVSFFVMLLALYGCSYHSQTKDPITPVTYKDTPYRAANSIGKLRRLAVMPIEIESYNGKYASEKEQEAAALSYQETVAKFMIEKKGYEIVVVRDEDGKWQDDLLGTPGHDNIKDLYQKWHKEPADKHTTSVIQKVGRALHIDGVLVIRIKERKPWGVTEMILNIALLDIPLFYAIASPNIGAWIYEVSTGRLVWREEHSADTAIFGLPGTTTDFLISLFANLENAVPHQLIK